MISQFESIVFTLCSVEVAVSVLYRIKSLSHTYPLGINQVVALSDINLEINQNSISCFVGPSGSGKSTLLSILGLIEPFSQGTVYFKDQEIGSLSEKNKNLLRRYQLGFIFQEFHLMQVLTALENVEYFLARQKLEPKERKKIAEWALDQVGLGEHKNKMPSEMSGGQRQRVAIARAIAKKPAVIIADEPTASLDQQTGRAIVEILSTLNKEQGTTVIMASHDPMVLEYCTSKYTLNDGKILGTH